MRGARIGLLSGAVLTGLELLLRYLPQLHGTDIAFSPALPLLAALLLMLPAALAGLLHPRAGPVVLVLLAAAGSRLDPAAVLLAVLAGVLGTVADRRPGASLGGLAAALLALLLIRPPAPVQGTPARPDVIVVVMDTVSAAATSLHGASLDTTPHLRALAREGVHYAHALSAAPWTVPAHAAMFTGQLPRQVGCHHEHPQLSAAPQTTAEALAAAGYRTGAFVANPWVGEFNGLTRGFAHQEHHWQRSAAARSFSVLGLLPTSSGKGGASTVRAALRWLQAGGDQPSFAFLNLLEAHTPFHQIPDPGRFGAVDPQTVGERLHLVQMHGPQSLPDFPRVGEVAQARRLYAAGIASADALLGELVAGLGSRLDDTVLIVTSDHGEAFGEHGFYGHMVGLHEQTLHVPLVIRYPAIVPAGEVVEDGVSLTGLHATVLSLAGLAAEGALPLHTTGTSRPVFSEQMRPVQVLADFQRGPVPASPAQLAALDVRAVRVALGESTALREGQQWHFTGPEGDRAALREIIEAYESTLRAAPSEAAPELSGDLREQLQALGYLPQ